MNKAYYFILTIGVLLMLACEPQEEQISSDGNLMLQVSNDTVLFDTLLTAKQSLTKRFRIYNPNSKAVEISDIRLGKGADSDYSVIINGKLSTSVQNEVLFGGDSLMVLVDVTIDPLDQNIPYLVKDSVIIEWNGNSNHVKLVAWGQDANYINNVAICDEVWTKDRPYVIYNLALVDSLCTLTVEPGTKIYIDNGASLFVQGSLKVLGDSGNHVTIRNTRFDENYLIAPGQWGGIFFLEGSKDNEIRYADIENGQVGLRVGSPDDDDDYDVTISHSTIRNMSVAGILAYSSDIYAYNTQIYNVNQYLVANLLGGNYKYEHCTFANNASYFINDDPLFVFTDNVEASESELLTEDLYLEMTNSIVWGRGDEMISFSNAGGAAFEVYLTNNIIKSTEDITGNFTSQQNNFPGFKDQGSFDFSLDSLAFARDKGIDINISDDINGMPRDAMPDIGAFERIDQQ